MGASTPTPIITTTIMTAGEADGAAAADPALADVPIRRFAFSHGLSRIQDLAREARMGDLADLWGRAFRSDIATVCQGTRDSRLFRS